VVVLDTTFIVELLNNKQRALYKAKVLSSPTRTTRLNVYEILVGIYHKNTSEVDKALEIFNDFLSGVEVLELDSRSTDQAARISAELRRRGNMVADNDVLIAGIALANGENVILTQNTKDFSKIKGIKVESY